MQAGKLLYSFLVNLPVKLCRAQTKGATTDFKNWRELQAEAADLEGSWAAKESAEEAVT